MQPEILTSKSFTEPPRKLKAQTFPSQRPMPKHYRPMITKATFPFSLSHVSLRGAGDGNKETKIQPIENDLILHSALSRTSTFINPVSGVNSNLKLDRSKTSIISREVSKNKFQDGKFSKTLEKTSAQVNKQNEFSEQEFQLSEKSGATNKFTDQGPHSTRHFENKQSLLDKIYSRGVTSDTEVHVDTEHSRTKRVYDADLRQYLHDQTRTSHSSSSKEAHRHRASNNNTVERKFTKEAGLPKPSALSHDYLDGSPTQYQEAIRLLKSQQSPRVPHELNKNDVADVDWLTRRYVFLFICIICMK